MTKAPTLTTISSGYASNTQLNNNFDAIQTAFENTLSLDGSTPNAMNADLDMDSNNILNVNEIGTDYLRINGQLVVPSTAIAAPNATDVDYNQGGTGAVSRTVASRLQEYISVKDFGAVGDGVTNDTAAFLAAALAAGASNPIYVPSGIYNKSTIPNEDTYFWICGEAFSPGGTNPISLLGHVEQAFNNRRLISKTASSANEFAEVQLNKTFNYTGGTSGNVSSNLHLTTAVSQNVTNFVWGITSVLNNSADAGENVAIYGQGNRVAGVGPIWGGVFEARDKTNTSGVGKSGTVGIEVDVFANGVVAGSFNRVGIDVVAGKGDPTGDTCQVGYGVRVGPQGGSVSNATFLVGYSVTGTTAWDFSAGSAGTQAGFNVAGTPISGFRISGTCNVGLNTSLGTITSNAVRLASTQNIAMEATGVIKTSWGVTANIWGFYNDTTERFGINTTTGVLRVNGTQVIAARQTGWAAPTGTATRTTFVTSTVTTAQLAERVKALIDDLTIHGLIGA